jgi:hypothetical protein
MAREATIVSFSPENIVTVTLMGAIGFAVLGFLTRAIVRARRGEGAA